MNLQNKLICKAVGRYLFLIAICLLLLVGCEGLQVNIPVEVQSVKREEAALLVIVENKSSRLIKITYPISTDFIKKEQHAILSFPKPGNHKVVVVTYTEDRRYRDVYQPVSTVELPVFLNGYDVVRARGEFVGYYLEVTDGMLFPNK